MRRLTVFLGDTIHFVIRPDVNISIFTGGFSIYLYNSVISYELEKDLEWVYDAENNIIIVDIPPEETVNYVTGDYNLIIKGYRKKVRGRRKFIRSAMVPNVVRVEGSPAKFDFLEIEDM